MASIKKKIAKVASCPTCAAISAVLAASKVPGPIRAKIAYDDRIQAFDSVAKSRVKRKVVKRVVRPLTKKAKGRAKILSEELKAANKRGRKKTGGLKKGYTQSRIMKEAHKRAKRRY
jgi:hypothetical protein